MKSLKMPLAGGEQTLLKCQLSGKAIVLLALTVLCTGCFAAEIQGNAALESVKAVVLLEGSGEIKGNLQGTKVELSILSFKNTEAQKVLSLDERLEINGKKINGKEGSDEFGNRYALFEVSETGKFSYSIEALIETDMKMPDLQDYDLGGEILDFPEFLKATANIQPDNEAIRTLAFNSFGKSSWIETVVETTQWVYDNIEYDLAYYPETYPAVEVLKNRKGVCDEFSALSASILRARGIPTRVVTGLTFNPKEGRGWNHHAWLESWNPETGWVPSDPTFGEAGAIGGSHITRGFFDSPENSAISTAKTIKNVTVTVEENAPKVEIESAREFQKVFSLQANDIVMPANQWHSLTVKAENLLDKTVISPFILVLPADFRPNSSKMLFVFKPKEEKQVSWDMRIDKQLEKNHYLTGSYDVYAIGGKASGSLKVMPGESFSEEAKAKLLSLIPLIEENTLVFEASLENIGAKEALVKIGANGTAEEFSLGAFEKKTLRLEIPDFGEKEYTVSVSGPGVEYSADFTVHEGKAIPAAEEPPIGGIPGIPDGFSGGGSSFLFTEWAIIVAILVGLAVIVLLLKELLSR